MSEDRTESAFQLRLQLAAEAGPAWSDPPITPHHPLACGGPLQYHEDGTMQCEHAVTWPQDRRARTAINHSIALLILEMTECL
jgi:hypothetical protein